MKLRFLLILILLLATITTQTMKQTKSIKRDTRVVTHKTTQITKPTQGITTMQNHIWNWKKEPQKEHILDILRNKTFLGLEEEIEVKDTRPSFTWNVKAELRSITGTPPPSTGDWTINDTTIVEDSTLIINGSIIINETGTLILRNTSIYMNLTSDGEHWIDVYGNLTVLGSLITAYNTSNNYFIRVFSGAKLRIENSTISYAGYTWGTDGDKTGLWINTMNFLLKNVTFTHNYYGVYVYSAVNATITNCTFYENPEGLHIKESNKIIVISNKFINNTWGIAIYSSDNITIVYNNITNSDKGIHIYNLINSIIESNSFISSGLFVQNIEIPSGNSIINNTVNGKPLIYLENKENITIEEAGQVILVHCKNVNITNTNVSYTTVGIQLIETNNSVIVDNIVTHNRNGIWLKKSNNNKIMLNNISRNKLYGLVLYLYSNNNTIANNDITYNAEYGLWISYSSNNIIYLNNIIYNGNNLYTYSSTNKFNTQNKLQYIFNNSFHENYLGNYWSDYTGEDTNGDGVGDIPYKNIDYYPLVRQVDEYQIIYSLEIQSYEPTQLELRVADNTQIEFRITLNQIANVSWFVNGDVVSQELNVAESMLTWTFSVGIWNITVEAMNENGTVSLTWIIETYEPLRIISLSPSSSCLNVSLGSLNFSITLNQLANVSWFVNGSLMKSEYTISSWLSIDLDVGVYNVTFVGVNENGTVVYTWVVYVYSQTTPRLTSSSLLLPILVVVIIAVILAISLKKKK